MAGNSKEILQILSNHFSQGTKMHELNNFTCIKLNHYGLLIVNRLEGNTIRIESSLSRSATKEKKNGAGDKKYEQYHGFNLSVAALKAHQVMIL